MNGITRWVILIILIVSAITCYAYGNSTGVWGFVIVGAIFELAFWFGVFSKKEKSNS